MEYQRKQPTHVLTPETWLQERLDEARVVALRAHAARMWDKYPGMTEASVRHSMSDEAQRTGCTACELRAAALNLQFVRLDDGEILSQLRSDEPAPPTLRDGQTLEEEVERAR